MAASFKLATPTRRRDRSARADDGNALRAAVLGANDGLVSNFSLVMGMSGASATGAPVLIAGVAGLLAGSLSMALGEWLSVQSSREMYANLGVDPSERGGSAWTAAITSFVLFAVGAAVPLLPFLFASRAAATLLSAALSGVALFALGAGITLKTGRHPVWAGLRQLAFGMAAAAITFAIGTLLGTTVS